jgi:hypothetical protein
MTKLLQQVIAQIQQLPPEQQDAIELPTSVQEQAAKAYEIWQIEYITCDKRLINRCGRLKSFLGKNLW